MMPAFSAQSVAPTVENLQIELTTRCNCRCIFCGSITDGKDMAWEHFLEVLEVVGPGTNAWLFGNGEGLLYPRFLEALVEVKKRGARAGVCTNGMPVSRFGVLPLAYRGLDVIVFSIADMRAEQHERMQPGIKAIEVWENLKACALVGIETHLTFLLHRANLRQIPEAIATASDLGVKVVNLHEIQWGKLAAKHCLVSVRARNVQAAIEEGRLLCEARGMKCDARMLVR